MTTGIADKTKIIVNDEHGEPRKVVSGEALTKDEAKLLGKYQRWLQREQLIRWPMRCVQCEKDVDIYVDSHQIGILCEHRWLVYDGVVPFRELPTPDAESGVESSLIAVSGPLERKMNGADAWMLRQYKAFLQRRGLAEGLGCTRCDDAGRHPGCKTIIGTSTISIACRCRTRVHVGMTH